MTVTDDPWILYPGLTLLGLAVAAGIALLIGLGRPGRHSPEFLETPGNRVPAPKSIFEQTTVDLTKYH